jgi:membrane-associated HD superfamily phosphohydrolase
MSQETFDPDELVIKELPKPPGFGPVLVLLAILQTLAVLAFVNRVIHYAVAEDQPEILTIEGFTHLLISAWAVVNLVLLIKRRRLFIESMMALLAFNLLLSLLAIASAGQTLTPARWPVFLKLGIVTAILWLVYLARSKHVRKVCVR